MDKKQNQYALKYKDEYADKLYSHMKQGFSISSFNVEPSVSRSTIFQWLHNHEDFALAKERGLQEFLKQLELCLIIKTFGLSKEIQEKHISELEKLSLLNIDDNLLFFLLKKKCPKEYS